MYVEQLVENMHPIMSMSGGIELFAALMTLILFIGNFFDPSHKTCISRTLMGVLLSNTVMQASDAFLWFLLDTAKYVPVVRALNILSFGAGCVMIALYAYCVLFYIGQKERVSMKPAHGITIVCAIGLIAWIASDFNGMYYYFDENSVYCYGPLSWVNEILWDCLFCSSIFIVLFHRKILGWRETSVLISFGVLPIIASPLEAIWEITPRYVATALSIMMVYVVIHVAQSKLLLEKELELADSRVRLLLGQIQPHFIFNSLQSIEELCVENPTKAGQIVRDFSKYLRGNLDAMSCDHLIPFTQELEHIRHYLAIEQADPDSRIEAIYQLDITAFYVPSLSVQPIVENAVRHGIGTRPQGGTVIIATREEATAFIITVSDNGTGFSSVTQKQEERQRVGLQNVRARLDSQCGGSLQIETGDVGTTVTITIPKRGQNIREHNSSR